MEFTPEKRLPAASADPKPVAGEDFAVEDLFDFSNEDGAFDAHSDESSPVPLAVDSCNSSSPSGVAAPDTAGFIAHAPIADAGYRSFSGDICVQYDDAEELEWLSNLVEEDSFSSEDLQKLHLISGLSPSTSSGLTKAQPGPLHHLNSDADHQPPAINNTMFRPESLSVPAKARSKRSRAAPGSWASQLQTVVFPKLEPHTDDMALSPVVGPSPSLKPGKKKGGGEVMGASGPNGEGRRCLHCATDKTPQWRTGPMGPKTLCNACGVRYKSGRLVPEYRPAASPTFVLTKHSNSHRKVMELRRQKETVGKHQMQGDHHHHHHAPPPQFIHGGMIFDHVSNSDEYLIHQHVGPDFRQMI